MTKTTEKPYPFGAQHIYIANEGVLPWVVSSAAVIWVVTQRFSPTSGGSGEALRDDPNDGCGGDYPVGFGIYFWCAVTLNG